MTPIENLLSRLSKVRGRNGAWTACCPAHEDKSPSLAIKEGDDGRVLLHCFGGCDVHNVLGAVGMDMSDLFPAKRDSRDSRDSRESGTPVKKATFYASDLLRVIHFEALVVQIAAIDMANGKEVSAPTKARLMLAYQRIDEATRYANV